MATTFEQIKQAVNEAYNFFADTHGVDYCTGLNATDITSAYADIKKDTRWFPELKSMGF